MTGNNDFDYERLKKYRQDMHLSLAALAAPVGVAPKTIRAWEKGLNYPGRENRAALEAACKKPPGYFRKGYSPDPEAVKYQERLETIAAIDEIVRQIIEMESFALNENSATDLYNLSPEILDYIEMRLKQISQISTGKDTRLLRPIRKGTK